MPSAVAFLSASDPSDRSLADLAYNAGGALAVAGWDLIYGGTHQGMMRRLADGVLDEGGTVLGVLTDALVARGLAYERVTGQVVAPSRAARREVLVGGGAVTIALPGDLGTIEEVFSVLASQQAGVVPARPLLLVGPAEFWQPVQRLIFGLHMAEMLRSAPEIYLVRTADQLQRRLGALA